VQCPDERVILDLVAGRVPAEAVAVRDHLDSCEPCRSLVAALSSSSAGQEPLRDGHAVGRYLVAEEIGRGAMAVVYRARDPELDRDVALKLVYFRDGGTSGERLLREARAMARLIHPNITRIYDVGTEGDAVFLAMELVVGRDLAHWLRDTRSWRDAVRVFAAAADGLAAAHRAQLVHRDFKSSNVLVGDDGRVLVTDFGLVQSPHVHDREHRPTPVVAGSIALTRTGTIVGTPAYMAPELLAGDAVADELSDQFSFAVALYECLYGIRPFAGDDFATLRDEVIAGRVRAATADRAVPRWLHRIAMRGLGPRDERYPSMTAFAEALRAEPGRRRYVAGAAALAVVAAAATITVRAGSTDAVDPCDAGEAQIAAVWSPMRAFDVRAAFARTGLGYASAAYDATAVRLDRFRTEWASGYRAACAATRAQIQSEELLDRRMQCLAARRQELSELVAVLASANRAVVDGAPKAADRLSRVVECANTVALGTLAPPPASATPAAVASVRASIARVHAHRSRRDPKPDFTEVKQMLAAAQQLGYAPVTAEANLAAAGMYFDARATREATQTVEEAVIAAEEGRHFKVKAQALTLALDLAYATGDLAGAPSKDRLARAALAAIGGDVRLEASLESVLGSIASRQRDLPRAEAHMRRSLALVIRALGEQDFSTARARINLAIALHERGDFASSDAELQKGLAIERGQLGPRHPAVAQTLGTAATMWSVEGRHREALAAATEALQIQESMLPPGHRSIAAATVQLADVYHRMGDFEKALPYSRRAVEQFELAVGPEHPDTGRALAGLAATLSELKRDHELVPIARRALAIDEKVFGADSPGTETSRQNLAVGLVGIGKPDEALVLFEHTLALREKAYGKDAPQLLATLLGMAMAHRSRGDRANEIKVLERAVALDSRAKLPREQVLVARMSFELAQALRRRGDRRRARQLAERAVALYRAHEGTDEVAEIERWLAHS
jgi:tetratricopeptide (TPR) repeat protein